MVDQYWAHEITGLEIFQNYLSRNRPILIRGLIDNWPAVDRYSLKRLLETDGDSMVQQSSIPYSSKFGGDGMENIMLRDYIHQMRNHSLVGGTHPWYVFVGTPLSRRVREDSLVDVDVIPTPPVIAEALHYVNMGPNYRNNEHNAYDRKLEVTRKDFINAQWALGGEGTGAPIHFHNTAWNALLYGAKKWFLYPPSDMIMSSRQIREFVEEGDLKGFADRGVQVTTCVQVAGDVMIVPESWGHGVLNIQESVAVATESKGSMWRVRANIEVMKKLPDNNRDRYKSKNEPSPFADKLPDEIAMESVDSNRQRLDRKHYHPERRNGNRGRDGEK
ncbi:unnamed protein product [Symbiodinium microadriaticum]|nr:unnamed protein product [Symbiodinium microadriaticum]